MPSTLLSAKILTCEKILVEADSVVSLVRLVDVFFVHQISNVPPESQAVVMQIFVTCSFPADDEQEHELSLVLKRPDGTEKIIEFGEALKFSFAGRNSKVPGAPKGHVLGAPWGVKPTHTGRHEIILSVDGERAGSTFFTLVEPQVISD